MRNALKKSTIAHQAADILRERIISGQYAQGERLAEEDLAKEFEVSRASVREALRMLETEGVLIREINKCTYVRKFTKKEIKALFQVRSLLERQSVAFSLAGNCIPDKELRKYLEEMKRSEQIGSTVWKEYLLADIGFHYSIIKMTDNLYITEFWQHLQSQYLMVAHMLRAFKPNAFFGPSSAHEKILEQLLAGNKEPWFRHLYTLASDVDNMLNQL